MKAAAEKSSTTTSPAATQEAKAPFFPKRGEGDFFAPAASAPAVQMKLAVSQPGDRLEQEAEKMSDTVMRLAPGQPPKEEKLQRQPEEKLQKADEPKELQRQPDEKLQKAESPKELQRQTEEKVQKAALPEEKKREEEENHHRPLTNLGELQRKESGGAPAAGTGVQSAIQSQTSGGEPISGDVRNFMEPRFGADFSNVRIHNDEESADLNDQLSARAFTYQNHVFFSRNQYHPGTSEGKQLLAHELTHTLQQGHAVQRESADRREEGVQRQPDREKPESGVQRAAKAAKPPAEAITSSQVVDLSSGTFAPNEKVGEEIAAQGHKGLDVRVAVKGLTGEGVVKVRRDQKKNFDSVGKPGSMPVTAPWAELIGGVYVNFRIVSSEIKQGYASLKPGGGDTNDWLQALHKNAALLGGLGLKVENLPRPVNKFEGGVLTLGVTNLKVEVGGFVDAHFNVSIENANKPRVEASAEVNVKGMAKGELKLDNTKDKLAGELSLAIEYKSFSGLGVVKYNPDGTIDITGKAAYNADKLSGEINFVSTDLETAKNFTRETIAAAGGKEKIQEAPPPAPVPAPKPGKKQRAIAATGQLQFNITQWFAGTVWVIVDGMGHVTVIGKIAPPAEKELFPEKPFDKELFKLEARAYYGIPVVGNLNVFANVSLTALARLGPAKIYNIEILGTYSTDPEVQKFIQISASINVSAYAGLKLRAEGGAGIEIASHDLKFGVGVETDIGVKAYVDARPTVGFRDPGVFYISGTLDMVAQPMFALGGDFFISLKTPWWSPLSDDRWTWPLFKKEWPLGDPIGLSALLKEYEFGSGKIPEIELKKPEFDPGKFMTKMVDNDLPDKSGKEGGGQGTFKDDGTVQKPEIPPKKPEPKKTAGKKPAKQPVPAKGGKSAQPDPKGDKEKDVANILQAASKPLAALKSKGPFVRGDLDRELKKIKAQVPGVDFDVQVKGENWLVRAKAGGKVSKGVEIPGKDTAVDGLPPEKVDETPINWTFAQITFREADGTTHVLRDEGGDEPQLMIESDPKAAKDFLDWYLEKKQKKHKTFRDRHKEVIERTYGHISTAQKLARGLARLKKKRARWKDKQQELLEAHVHVGTGLSEIVGKDPALGKAIEKYGLEGMTGTYASIPRPPYDDLTPDHQPQAAILTAIARFRFFSKTGELSERAAQRAHHGYAINLHKNRHVEGATYGSKGKETKEEFLARVKPKVKDKPAAEQRAAVIALVREDLNRDVKMMKDLVKASWDDDLWSDVVKACGDDKEAKTLVGQIRGRINRGEDQIAHQDLDLD